MRLTYKVDGLKESSAALQEVPPAVRAIWAEEFAKMALEIEGEYKRKVRRKSGRTAAGIGHNIREDGLQATVGNGVMSSRFLELGTSRSRKFPALYPAFRRSVRDHRRRMKTIEPRLRAKIRRGRKAKK